LSDAEIEKMRQEAKANEAADKAEREKIDKINAADTMIFSTEKQLNEYGDKLSAGNKSAIEGALAELKAAHATKDVAAIDSSMEKINAAWQAASQEMYAQGGMPNMDNMNMGGQPNGNPNGNATANEGVTDVNYEEVK
jgi:molecular chaperone DnaK